MSLKVRDGKDMDRWIAEELSACYRFLAAANWHTNAEDWWIRSQKGGDQQQRASFRL